jgi:hypothetical protein
VSGPHDFAVRKLLARQARRRVHRIPLRVRDVAQRRSEERDGANTTTDFGFGKSEIFFARGLDRVLREGRDLPVG